jgi:hypothetical protein
MGMEWRFLSRVHFLRMWGLLFLLCVFLILRLFLLLLCCLLPVRLYRMDLCPVRIKGQVRAQPEDKPLLLLLFQCILV